MANSNLNMFLDRLNARTQDAQANSPRMKLALNLIGMKVRAYAILNIRRQHIINTGNLLNNTRYQVNIQSSEAQVQIGTFGVPYAAAQEFGFRGVANVRPHDRIITNAFGKSIDARVVRVRQHNRRMNIKARPYLRPAVLKARSYIMDTLRAVLSEAK